MSNFEDRSSLDGNILTPIPDSFLDGITRRSVIEIIKSKGIKVVEKKIAPQEIKDFVIEMEERSRSVWKESEEDILLQIKFWNLFQKILEKVDITKFDKIEKRNKIFVINLMRNIKKKAKFSSKFLKENKVWIQ